MTGTQKPTKKRCELALGGDVSLQNGLLVIVNRSNSVALSKGHKLKEKARHTALPSSHSFQCFFPHIFDMTASRELNFPTDKSGFMKLFLTSAKPRSTMMMNSVRNFPQLVFLQMRSYECRFCCWQNAHARRLALSTRGLNKYDRKRTWAA